MLAIVVEDLDNFCEYRSLIEEALDRHLDLKFAGRFEPDPNLLPDTIHYQVRQVCLVLVQVLKIRAIKEVKFSELLLAEAEMSPLLKRHFQQRLLDCDECHPVVDDPDEHDEYSLFLASVILFDLVIEVYDLIDAPMDKAEREVKHVNQHEDFVRVDLRIRLQVPQLSVDPQQVAQMAPFNDLLS